MAEWKDATSYSRDRERVPTSWALDLGELRISITSGHLYYPGKWVMHCEPWFNTKELSVETKEEAQAKALAMVRQKVEKLTAALATAPSK